MTNNGNSSKKRKFVVKLAQWFVFLAALGGWLWYDASVIKKGVFSYNHQTHHGRITHLAPAQWGVLWPSIVPLQISAETLEGCGVPVAAVPESDYCQLSFFCAIGGYRLKAGEFDCIMSKLQLTPDL